MLIITNGIPYAYVTKVNIRILMNLFHKGVNALKKYWHTVLIVLGFAVFTIAGSLGAKRVGIVQHDLRASTSIDSIRLVQISDLHLNAFGTHEQGLITRVLTLNADVVLLSGDAVDRADALPLLRSFVKGLAPVPVLLVPGNWEHWSGLDFVELQNLLSASGAQLLLNDRWSFSRGDRTLQIIGLDDFTAGQPDLGLLDTKTPRAGVVTVLVQHSPAFFEQTHVTKQMAMQRFDLCLAGHTHGGQLALGGWAPYTPVGSGRFVAGFYDVPGCPLFVSRGVGTSVLPIRFGAPAEVVVFDL
jgi:predicted MPP superfamily phosphohydrolase